MKSQSPYYIVVAEDPSRKNPIDLAKYSICDTAIERAKKLSLPKKPKDPKHPTINGIALMVVRVEWEDGRELRTIRAFVRDGKAVWGTTCSGCDGRGKAPNWMGQDEECRPCHGYGAYRDGEPITLRAGEELPGLWLPRGISFP